MPELGIIMKIMANKMGDQSQECLIVQVCGLAALCAIIFYGGVAAIRADDRFVVVMRHNNCVVAIKDNI